MTKLCTKGSHLNLPFLVIFLLIFFQEKSSFLLWNFFQQKSWCLVLQGWGDWLVWQTCRLLSLKFVWVEFEMTAWPLCEMWRENAKCSFRMIKIFVNYSCKEKKERRITIHGLSYTSEQFSFRFVQRLDLEQRSFESLSSTLRLGDVILQEKRSDDLLHYNYR